MKQTPIYKFVVAGYSHIGRRHCEVIAAHPNCELVAIIDINERLENEVRDKYGVPFFNSLEAFFLTSLETDIINICTPNGLHTSQSLTALNFYCHVICEKPMGLRSADCAAVIRLSEEVGRKVFCVMQNRYTAVSRWLHHVVKGELLGSIFQVQVDCYWNRDHRYYTPGGWRGTLEYDGGPIYTQFSHFIDLLYWLFGDITNISARFANFNHKDTIEFEDSGFVAFDFANGGMGTFNYSTCAYEKNLVSSVTILAEKGTVKVSGQYMDKVEYCHIANYEMPDLAITYPESNSGHYQMIDNAIKTLNGEMAETATANDGMMVVDIIERIYRLRS
ncbi:MAG: Gfo/Idh/MocA family oxidoreductase [Chitinophagales bacterium]|nr:Gfo/Idh/MocA family oxidoreductase [Chitinophagales bacterium]